MTQSRPHTLRCRLFGHKIVDCSCSRCGQRDLHTFKYTGKHGCECERCGTRRSHEYRFKKARVTREASINKIVGQGYPIEETTEDIQECVFCHAQISTNVR